MNTYLLPYGNSQIEISLPTSKVIDVILPNQKQSGTTTPVSLVKRAIETPLGGNHGLDAICEGSKVVISINDKTRPVPNSILLPPLLKKILDYGVKPEDMFIMIASGTHSPMKSEEYCKILDENTLSKYQVIAHDSDDDSNLQYIGNSSAGTPVFVNKIFFNADFRIVVGDIEPHHFAGYSGGVKSAAIGFCGRKTINANHSLLLDPRSTVGVYNDNPIRNDIEEIGRMVKVDLALNAVLNEKKEILDVFFGRPLDVMREGIRVVNEISQMPIRARYDLVIASAGGYPKDINLYQAQKAMTHASLFCKEGGAILLAAECREGAGSSGYLEFMQGLSSVEMIKERFVKLGFSVGPHKALQVALIIEKHPVYLYSSMSEELVESLLLFPVKSMDSTVQQLVQCLPEKCRIAILPYATACFPKIIDEEG